MHDKFPLTAWRCVPALTRLIQEGGVDIVHARSRVPAWIGWAAARRAQRPFVTTAHGFYRPHPASRVMVWGRLVIAPSAALGDYLVQQFRLPKDRLRVIARGVDLEAFTFAPPPAAHDGPWRIGLFGRLSALKGHEIALEACARLLRQGVRVRLYLAGDAPADPRRSALDALIASWHLQDAVEWCGVRADIPQLIASMDLIIVPSSGSWPARSSSRQREWRASVSASKRCAAGEVRRDVVTTHQPSAASQAAITCAQSSSMNASPR